MKKNISRRALSAAFISITYLAVLALAPAAMASEEPNDARPLGLLFTPLPQADAGTIVDVHRAPPPATVRRVSKTLPDDDARPLGLLLAPLGDENGAPEGRRVFPLPGPTRVVHPAPAVITGENATTARPLGLLIAPPERRQAATPTRTAQTTNIRTPAYVPTTRKWHSDGRSADLPLGTLLIPGTYEPVIPVTSKRSTAASGVPSSPRIAPAPGNTAPLEIGDEKGVNFSADEMGFDKEGGAITARGNVEIRYQGRSLTADRVTYDRNSNRVIAEGNVVIVEPTSETIFGERVEITDDLRDGFILNIGIILQDRARIVGTSATRTGGRSTELNQAVYSPCDLCADDPNRPPVWQIKAVRVKHDQQARVVEYEDAWIEFFGIPVFYTPYFRHPDPTVKRKSGFLYPTLGNSSDLGMVLQTPYFLNISPHEDATITPIIMSAEKPVLSAEYRKRLDDGSIDVAGSITANSNESDDFETEEGRYGIRGHLLSKGRFDINRNWRWGFDANMSSDDTYMRRYKFGSQRSLQSRLFAESFKQRSYFSAQTMAFQDLQAGRSFADTPLLLPLVDFNHVGERDRLGGNTNFDFNFLSLSRRNGADTRRLSAHSKWQRPFAGAMGDLYNLSFGLNTDLYHVNGLSRENNSEDYNGFSHRVTPEAALEWRFPLVKSDGKISQIIEPITTFIWSPYGGNSSDIPNEDSTELELDDTNLFRANRFSGLDRVEGGPRIAYGLKWGVYGAEGGRSSFFIGQSWRPKKDDTFAQGSGLDDNFSDIVARVEVSPNEHLHAFYRTRLSPDDLSPQRNELSLSAGIPAFRVDGNYLFLKRQSDSEFAGREELQVAVASQLDRNWRTGFNATRDLDASEMRVAGLHLTYEDECVVFTSRLERTFFSDRDLEPTDAILFNLVLKTIGEVRSGASLGNQ